MMERSSSRSGSRSRRSYPLLNQISLTPLSARYPIDADDDDDDNTGTSHGDYDSRHSYYDGNDDQSQGYFSARSTSPERVYSGTSTPRTRTPPSYLTSFSVPGTPGPLSHSHSESRSASRTRSRRDRRSKSSSRMGSNLSSYDTEVEGRRRAPGTPGHQNHHQRTSTSNSTSGEGSHHHHRRHHGHAKSDSGWMLRTGIALAESTREEKGQSWLAKRQSSTSLASDAKNNSSSGSAMTRATSRPRSSKSRRPSSSGMSTPRWGPRSYAPSRTGSRPDLTMTTTGLEMTTSNANRTATTTPPSSGGGDDHSRGFRPDMVNARIRAEVALMQQQQQDGDGSGTLWQRGDRAEVIGDDYDGFDDDDDYYDDDYDRWSFDSAEEEIDEKEMYRLTRERGFGLGSWLDRMVEWTLFGVDEWPSLSTSAAPLTATTAAAAAAAGAANGDATGNAVDVSRELRDPQTRTTVSTSASGGADDDSDGLIGDTTEGDGNSVSDRDDKSSIVVVDKSGETGGWEDARWLFHAVRRALF